MTHSIFKVLHAYHPTPSADLALCNVMIYRDSFLLIGYQEIGKSFSSFVHFQFAPIPAEDVYSTQIQLIESNIPEAFRKAKKICVYHAEPSFVVIPKGEMESLSGYEIYNQLHASGSEKILQTSLDSSGAIEYYNYPYRVYNDAANAFESSTFFSYHIATTKAFSQESIGKKMLYISIKNHSVEFTAFFNRHLVFLNSYKYKNKADLTYLTQAVLKDLKIENDDPNIFLSTIRKEEKESIFQTMLPIVPNANQNLNATFGCDQNFWEIYADAFLVQKYA